MSRYNQLYRDRRAAWLRACHDTIDCIVTLGQWYGRWLCRDTTQPGLRYGQEELRYARHSACRGARYRATTQPPVPATRSRGTRDTAPGQACDTTRPGCDTVGAGPRHGAVHVPWAHHARSQGQLCVHIVHLTYFWTQCTVSVTVWTTVHKFFRKKIN